MKRFLFSLAALLPLTAQAQDPITEIGGPYDFYMDGGISFTNFVINTNSAGATIDRVATCFQSETSSAITHLGFRYGARTGTPVQHKISLQAASATAVGPDGTDLGGGTPATANFTPPADATWDGTWQWIDITDYTPTRGQYLCIVIAPVGEPTAGTHQSSFTTVLGGTGARRVFPYSATQTNAAAYAVGAGEYLPIYGYKTASRSYGNPMEAISSGDVWSSDSTPDERCLRFTLPSTMTGTYEVAGFTASLDTVPASAKSIDFNMYLGTNTTADQTGNLDTDKWFGNGGSARSVKFMFSDATLDTITAGTVVRLCIAPQSTGTSFGFTYFTADSNAELSAFAGGIEWYFSSRTDAGSWDSDNTLKRPVIVPIIQTITAAAAGGLKNQNQTSGGAQ